MGDEGVWKRISTQLLTVWDCGMDIIAVSL